MKDMVWVALIGGIGIGHMLGAISMCFMVNQRIKHITKRIREESGESEDR